MTEAEAERQREAERERQRKQTLRENQRIVREQIEEKSPEQARLSAYKNGTGVGIELMNFEEIKFNKDIFDKLQQLRSGSKSSKAAGAH
jgi:hypothetical protein